MGKLALPVHSYRHSSRPVGTERLVNCFAEASPPEGKSPMTLMRSPGTVSATTLGVGGGRGIYAWNGVLYAISGTSLYRVNALNVATLVGTITGTGRCTFSVNPTQLVVNSEPNAWVYDGATLTAVTDVDYTTRGGASACAIDGYILYREPNSGRFFCSDLNNASSYNALNFATAEGFPDNLVGLIVDHRQAMLLGAESIELWYDAGGSGFPFARDTNGFMELGCAAGASVTKADNSVYWLASDLTVRRLEGLTPTRISHHGVEQAIRSYSNFGGVSDAYGFSYTQEGHVFFVLTFPTGDAAGAHTWVFDATTQEWHERESFGFTRWRACGAAFCYGRNYVQDFSTGRVGYLDPNTYTEYGGMHRSEWTYGNVYDDGSRKFHSSLEVMIETGVGTTSGQGSDPQIMLDISNDGGRTWIIMPTQSIGAIGNYRTLVVWNALGSARDRVYRMAVSDPVRATIADTQLQVS